MSGFSSVTATRSQISVSSAWASSQTSTFGIGMGQRVMSRLRRAAQTW